MQTHYDLAHSSKPWEVNGIELGWAEAGIRKPNRKDLLVVRLSLGTAVGAVLTSNKFCAAPVTVCRANLLPEAEIRGLVFNTGVANAGTGQQGIEDARAVCNGLAREMKVHANSILPFSTGVILEKLPVDKVIDALPAAVGRLSRSNWRDAAESIMTTDTKVKVESARAMVGQVSVVISGIAKGSGMIHPNMATMLGFIGTDAKVSQNVLQRLVKDVADQTFNCISVDGDTSTNDAFVIAATGTSGASVIDDISSDEYIQLRQALISVAGALAKKIVLDGVGATKLISINVSGCRDVREARAVADAVAQSPMFKTAMFASDANIGRLMAAVGYAHRTCPSLDDLDPSQVDVCLGDVLIVKNGCRASSYTEEQGRERMLKQDIDFAISFRRGAGATRLLTCDLSDQYVMVNAAYRK